MGPLMDVPCSDYVFVLVDNVVRIFSLGSSTQVAWLYTYMHNFTLSLALPLYPYCIFHLLLPPPRSRAAGRIAASAR